MEELIHSGVYMFRGNFAHMSHESYSACLERLARLNKKLHTHVLFEVDLQGPHPRVGKLPENGIFLKERQEYKFAIPCPSNDIPVVDLDLPRYVKPGEAISFAGGLIEGEITKVNGSELTVRMINSGRLISHKSINVPEMTLPDGLTQQDQKDLEFLKSNPPDWVALSFVGKASDVENARAILGPQVKLMSKIERREAIRNLKGIIEVSDAVMVARGDLGIELPLEEIPYLQAKIIQATRAHHKPVVVATQMLFSMVHSLRPTRAEVSDVAWAVMEGADGLMLSDETTIGIDPVNAVETLIKIVAKGETQRDNKVNYFDHDHHQH